MSQKSPAPDDFAAQIAAARNNDEFTVLMKNYIATHFRHLLGSKVLLLNTRDGLDTLSAMVKDKLASRAARNVFAPQATPERQTRVA